jgi:hypothetical protein
MKITKFTFSILAQFTLVLSLDAALTDAQKRELMLLAANGEDRDIAIDLYRKIEGKLQGGTARKNLIDGRLKLADADIPQRWAELDNNDKIANAAVEIYRKHAADLADPLSKSNDVTDANIKAKLANIAAASR